MGPLRRRGVGTRAILALAVALAVPAGVRAEDAGRPLCPARPGKASPACTVEPGRVQLEIDLADSTVDRSAGTRTASLVAAAPQLRIGLTPSAELQLGWTPYERRTSRDAGGHTADSGVGDAFVGTKVSLTGDRQDLGLALQPFIKLPTARQPIGNGRVEGGMAAPMTAALAGGWSLGASPELDLAADEVGDGRHLAGSLAVGLGHALTPALSLGAELWLQQDFIARAGTQATGDLMLAWTPARIHDVQFDVGLDLGLTRAAPDAEAYAGFARRF